MASLIQAPETSDKQRRRWPVWPLGAIAAVGFAAAVIHGGHSVDQQDDSAQRAVVQIASGTVEASATCDAGQSLVQVRVTGLTPNATVRVAVDTDTDTAHAENIADGRTVSTQLGASGDGGADLDRIVSGPATVRLYSSGTELTDPHDPLHLTIPTC